MWTVESLNSSGWNKLPSVKVKTPKLESDTLYRHLFIFVSSFLE